MKNEWPAEFPGAHWMDDEEERAVVDVIRSRSVFRYYGPKPPKYAAMLEEAAKEFYVCKYALAVNSGTGALLTTMTALGIGPGCEVIVPAFMWISTVSSVAQMRAIPVLAEIDHSFSIDPADIERKITPRTKLIVAIHMAGAPCHMEGIMAVADKRGIPVLEDCAQANGGSFKGKKLGTIGRMGMFSLQLNKNMTSGEGGLIITDDRRLYERALSAHDLGVPWVRGAPVEPGPDTLLWGGGRRMSELCAAVAAVQIKKLPAILEHMRASKKRIKAGLAGTPGLSFRRLNDEEGDTAPFLVLMLENEATAVAVLQRLKDTGIQSASRIAEYGLHIYYNIMALVNKVGVTPAGDPWTLPQNAESVYDYNKGACPVSDGLFARSVIMPIPSRLTAKDEGFAVDAIKKAVQESRR